MENEEVRKELEKARKEAVSIGAYNVPDCPQLLGIVEEGVLGKVYYYRDKAGRYFYQSERTIKVEKEMQDARRRKQKETLHVKRNRQPAKTA